MQSIESVTLNNDSTVSESLLQAKELVNQLELGNIEKADIIISDLCKIRENDLYQEIGKLTRDLHETMNDLSGDTRLRTITNKEMTDARHDLDHVIGLTEESANKTLTAIEHSMPLLDTLSERAMQLRKLLQTQINESANSAAPGFIAAELDAYFDMVISDTKSVHNDMNSVLVAQGYQDITGQIIQRVSKMVQDVEQSLVGILQVNSHNINQNEQNKEVKNNAGYGPSVPGDGNADVMQNQDDVDELLSTLGF